MLKVMMDLLGKFPQRMLRRGQFTHKHFDENLTFMYYENNKPTPKVRSAGAVQTTLC